MSINKRIHVNGTRGKSSVVQYIFAGLNRDNQVVSAKITGEIPTIIKPDGTKKIIKRVGPARVQEQFKFFNYAKKNSVDTLILECMSIAPELQRLESSRYKPQIYVITNIKDDHQEKLGSSLKDQVNAISSAIPKNCKVITNQVSYLDLIEEKAKKQNSIVIKPERLDTTVAKRLPEGVFAENIEIALEACKQVGVIGQDVLGRILEKSKETKKKQVDLTIKDKSYTFLNGFNINDIQSAEDFAGYWHDKIGKDKKISIILNTRADRPTRTVSFAKFIAKLNDCEKVLVTGNHTGVAVRKLKKEGFKKERIKVWKNKDIENLDNSICTDVEDESIVIGFGNIANAGYKIIEKVSA